MNESNPIAESLLFAHEAMNTEFHLRLLGMDEQSAAGLAKECFHQVDRLENQLSRFIETSEVSRINTLAAGETLYVSDECHRCLLLAMDAVRRTHGLFDVTQGRRIEHRKSGGGGPQPEVTGRLMIHPDVPAVTCVEEGRVLDLGGIGKGFALDHLKLLLDEWRVDGALLSAGASSMLAYGRAVWPVDLTAGSTELRLQLANQALSASGIDFQGSHIVHPWGEEAMPSRPCKRVWVVASTAALSEIWSTALMLVGREDAVELLAGESDISACHVDDGEGFVRIR